MDKIEDNGAVISGGTTPEPNVETSRKAVTFGDYLDWESPLVPVSLLVELPFWLMIDDCELDIPLGPSQVRVTIHSRHREVYMGEVTDSRRTLVYRGPDPDRMNPEILQI